MSTAPSKPRGRSRLSDRRGVIRDSAASLFAKQGVASTSVREIADAVGILSGSLYHHFASKDEIVDEIITTYLDGLLGRFRAVADEAHDPRAALETLIRESFLVIRDHPDATQIYQNDATLIWSLPSAEHTKAVAAEVQQIWMDVIDRGVANGTFRDTLDSGVVYRLLRDSIWLTQRWFKPTGKFNLEDLADQCVELYLDGLTA